MKKFLIAWVIMLLFATGYHVIAATTFSWSGPAQTGTLTYDGLKLNNPEVTGTETNTGSLAVTSNLVVGVAVELGHATDTSLTRASAGVMAVEGKNVYMAGGTDVAVADGGTGAGTLTDGGVLLGSGTNAVTAMAVLTDGQMIVGDGTTDPVAESGATLRTSIGVGTGDSPQFTAVELGNATDTTIARSGSGDATIEGNAIYRAGGTDVAVADGGTGLGSGTSGGVLAYTAAGTLASSAALTDNGVVIGGGAGAVPESIAVGTDNQVLKGSTGAAPAFGALADADVPNDLTISGGTVNSSVIGGVTPAAGTFTDVTATGTITLNSKVVDEVAGVTAVAESGSAVNYMGALHYDVFTFTNVTRTATDGGDRGLSAPLVTFPEGRILIMSAAIDCTVTCSSNFNASTDDVFVTSIGTASNAVGDATLSGTEVDIIASTEHDTASGDTVSFAWEADMTAGGDTVFDGTTTAVQLFWNAGVLDANTSGDVSITNAGTANVIWAFLGDD